MMLLTQRQGLVLRAQSSQNISICLTNKYIVDGILEIYVNKINAVF